MMTAFLALEDGKVFKGRTFAGKGEAAGEVVFNTSMTGYQEILTDPSYKGQIINMTYPLMGNYGINPEDVESKRIHAEAFIVKEHQPVPSSWRSVLTLAEYLDRNNVIGIEGIDTRALTRHLRLKGAMKGIVSTEGADPADLVRKAKEAPGLVGRDLVEEVTCRDRFTWSDRAGFKVVVLDFGVKFNILNSLAKNGCSVVVVPARTSAAEVRALNPDGVLLSNGPGDPEPVTYAISTIRELIGEFPMMGICLGQQLIGLALGGRTYKLKFGHRGANHPVKNLRTGKVEITSQNHGFCVDPDSIRGHDIEPTHINLNDGTLEGMRHKELPVFSVQYHPEASPGPHDAAYLFSEFVYLMRTQKKGT
ncbi:MAG TPA: glutamine-hydrolyzing carbamoyl-phosphate synthase small subunit [Syntrophales bacterium]|nr:glutamine-hydrolyzing carbamoyl-phosphate synthase small subunit [Syntrophales bacterium]